MAAVALRQEFGSSAHTEKVCFFCCHESFGLEWGSNVGAIAQGLVF